MKKSIKYLLITAILLIVVVSAGALYMFYMPQRNIQGEKPSYTLDATQFVNEFLDNQQESNSKYLDRVIILKGTVAGIDNDQQNQKVIHLKTDKAGINCTFMNETNANTENLDNGSVVKIKGVVRLGASYDNDMELYEYAILEKCDLVK